MKKNIVMILTDQMHKYAMGFLREHIKTPNLDKLASEGVTFLNAYSNNPVCGPFRGNLFTGMYTCDNGVNENGDPLPDVECLADTFNINGYETSFVGKWHLGDAGNKPIPESLRGGFKHFIGYQCFNGFINNISFYDENNEEHVYDTHRTDTTTDIGIERLKMVAGSDKPFLHVIFYQAPHYPEHPSEEFAKLYEDKNMPYPLNYKEVDPYTPTYSPYSPRPFDNCSDYQKYGNNMQEYMRLYNGMVTQIDYGIGRILDEVHRLGLDDNTMVLFSSDHGDMQGSHGLKNKCLPYEESCGIPLIIKTPDCNKGAKIKMPVSCIDYYPTCIEYANATSDREFDGVSLIPFVDRESSSVHKSVFAENYLQDSKWVMVRDGKYKLVVKMENNEPYLMFDMENDPYEMNNLVENDDFLDIKEDLQRKIMEWNNR